MTLQERADAYAAAFPEFPASHLRVVQEAGRDVLYGTWLLGNDYRNASPLYGSYPPSYLSRVMCLFPDVEPSALVNGHLVNTTMHVCSGALPRGPYVRLDVNADRKPDIVGSVYDVAAIFDDYIGWFELLLADPPYSTADAAHYETGMVDRRRAIAALAQIARVGAHLVWLDTTWPMHRKAEWRTVGRINLIRSTNHRVRLISIFERTDQ